MTDASRLSGAGGKVVSPFIWGIALALLFLAYWGGLAELVHRWDTQEEYSHGFFIPLISLWLLWRRRSALRQSFGPPSWVGLLLVAIASGLLVLGELTAIYLLIQFGFMIGLIGLVLVLGGLPLLRVAFLPIAFLLFAIPLPYFIDAALSWRLQLVSSQLGAGFLKLVGVPVYIEGNVIDLGFYKLQVVDACSGLRYLYPLLSLGFLMGYMYQAALWKRAVVFLSTIPITVLMNSLRIAIVGLLVERWGSGMADGFLHYFEGWVIFMACLALLLAEIGLLERLGLKRHFQDALGVPQVAPAVIGKTPSGGRNYLLILALVIIIASAAVVRLVGSREEIQPERLAFANFPTQLGEWSANESSLPEAIEKGLKLDDYLMADFKSPDKGTVNFYVAYYASQRKGASPHSPEVCIPGGGWLITSLTQIPVHLDGRPVFKVNRTVISRDGNHMVVYYWFDERGRQISNEYWAKWYLLEDALLRNRTDGALVRITLQQRPGESIADVDGRAMAFMKLALPKLTQFVPE
jgi:exosortase D (VPLPA-CTERM-specific)